MYILLLHLWSMVDLILYFQLISVGGHDNNITIFKIESKKKISEEEMNDIIFSVNISQDYKLIAVGEHDNKITIFKIESKKK